VKKPRIGDHNVAMTAALGAVLIALAAFVIQGTVQTSRAADEQHEALAVDLLFADVRNAVSMQEVHLRHYEVQPDDGHLQQSDEATQAAVGALATIAAGDDPWARQDALRLRHQQVTYQMSAKRMMAMVLENERAVDRPGGPPAYVQVDRELVTPAFYARHQALHDALTGLPNRVLFAQRLDEALDDAATTGHQAALMVIDLDGFKQVNDTLGHHAGDTVLVEAGCRLATGAGGAGLVARLGGVEFAVLLPCVADLNEAVAVGDRIITELRRDFALAEGPAGISGSLGIALGPWHGDAADLFRHADAAMYRAKSGGGGVAWHEPRASVAA
jgi:diguanylate cyclase (GGDEF)-like protein